jgi:acyl carrier protein
MFEKTNLERLQEVVGEQLGIEPNKVRPEADFTKELGADSLDIVELVMAIEDEFSIDIEDKKAAKIATIQDALNYIEDKWEKE